MDITVCNPGKFHDFLRDIVEDMVATIFYTQSLNSGPKLLNMNKAYVGNSEQGASCIKLSYSSCPTLSFTQLSSVPEETKADPKSEDLTRVNLYIKKEPILALKGGNCLESLSSPYFVNDQSSFWI